LCQAIQIAIAGAIVPHPVLVLSTMAMACGNCLPMLWEAKKAMSMAMAMVSDEASPCDGAPSLCRLGKQACRRVSTCSTTGSSGSTSGSDPEGSDVSEPGDSTMDTSGMKVSGKFPCPHCFQKFETKEELCQHDACMIMPSDMDGAARSGDGSIRSVGVKLDGKIQCPDCNQKFDTEKALSMHCKFIHDRGSEMNIGYTLVYEFDKSKLDT